MDMLRGFCAAVPGVASRLSWAARYWRDQANRFYTPRLCERADYEQMQLFAWLGPLRGGTTDATGGGERKRTGPIALVAPSGKALGVLA